MFQHLLGVPGAYSGFWHHLLLHVIIYISREKQGRVSDTDDAPLHRACVRTCITVMLVPECNISLFAML